MGNTSKSKAQSLVEFAFALPVLLFLVLGVFDLSRLFSTKIVLNNAAREGAYFLSRHPSDKVYDSDLGVYTYKDTAQAIQNEANSSGLSITESNILISDADCCTYGEPIEVALTYDVDLIWVDLLTGPITLSSRVRMLVQ